MNNIEVNEVDILVNNASDIIDNAFKKINTELIIMYYNIGELVNNYKKEHNSKYGDSVILRFSEELNKKYGSGFSRKNINRMCLFNEKFNIGSTSTNSTDNSNKIGSAPTQSIRNDERVEIMLEFLQNISWWHYVELLNIDDKEEIKYYLNEIQNNKWPYRYLIEQKKNKAYQRLICNQKKGSILPVEKSLKDPLILPLKKVNSEKELEREIVTNIFDFMNELGSGYLVKGNQVKIIINNSIYKIDLVFYNEILKSYVLIDLKVSKVTRNDIAQMNMYISYYNKHELKESYNKTIGIILTTAKNLDINDYVNPDENLYQVLFVTKMPSVKELETIIKENTIFLLGR